MQRQRNFPKRKEKEKEKEKTKPVRWVEREG